MGTPPDQTDAPFAEALTALKQAAGMSYRDLAAQLVEQTGRGLSPSFLSALAKGIERPSPETIADIARVFGKDERLRGIPVGAAARAARRRRRIRP